MFVYKLYPIFFTKLHLGKGEINNDLDIIHSDTLFSAIINCYKLIYGEKSTKDIIDEFSNRRIIISSLFYFIDLPQKAKTQNTIYFFPKPNFIYDKAYSTDAFESSNFISYQLLKESILNFNIESRSSKFNSDINTISGEFCYAKNEYTFDTDLVLKQKIPQLKASFNYRRTQPVNMNNYLEANIFLSSNLNDELSFRPGLYFLAEINSKYHRNFDSAIRLLCDEGIGGKRTFGGGQFSSVNAHEFQYEHEIFKFGRCHINFSLISPDNREVKLLKENIIRYSSIVRSGWTPNNLKTKNVRMIREGSVFNNKILGKLTNVTPLKFDEHKIFRNGIGFFL